MSVILDQSFVCHFVELRVAEPRVAAEILCFLVQILDCGLGGDELKDLIEVAVIVVNYLLKLI